ncbi:YihY/virulence factor BrkB family protein [Swingsia samuiensis]|uniref:YihY/virulence factor BrkB family protein n=1 Tax=Swingsia samuiensis TaxID=1293412 RepID=A0A4Y6UNR3_9PROT|nr:YihY/virulence factor BrkB family protein [Swingsia samuiensis]
MKRIRKKLSEADREAIIQVRKYGLEGPGTGARSPFSMPWGGWKLVFRQVFSEAGSSETSLSAAGCAFYATLSLFPAISSLISVYGLVFDLNTVEPQLELLRHLLPPAAYTLIGGRIHELVSQPHTSLTIGLIFSLFIALWSASASTKSMLSALNMAYNVDESRGFISFQLTALITTLVTIMGAALTLALMVAAPALVDYLPDILGVQRLLPPFDWLVSYGARLFFHTLGPILMLLFVFVFVTLLYRFGPSRKASKWRWIIPGSLIATFFWVLTSLGFSWYVAHFASYSVTYGPLGAVAAIMMWFFVSVYVVLVGAEFNASLEERAKGSLPRIAGMPQVSSVVSAAMASNEMPEQ